MKILLTVLVITGLFSFGCCPKQTNETAVEIIPAPPSGHSGWDTDRGIYSKSVVANDEITRPEESDSFVIVDLKSRDTGLPPMPRRRLNQKKYISVRAKGGDAQ